MRGRVVAVTATLAGVGAALGAGVAWVSVPEVTTSGTPTAVTGSPAVPTGTPPPATPSVIRPYASDIAYQTLLPQRAFDRLVMDQGGQAWSYVRPRGWQAYGVLVDGGEDLISDDQIDEYDEVRFRPPDEPTRGGYSLRVKAVNDHVPPSTMVQDKLRALRAAQDAGELEDLDVTRTTDSALYMNYRTVASNRLRYNFFAWFAAPDATSATLEMSIVGRAQDQNGLRLLFDEFGDRVKALR